MKCAHVKKRSRLFVLASLAVATCETAGFALSHAVASCYTHECFANTYWKFDLTLLGLGYPCYAYDYAQAQDGRALSAHPGVATVVPQRDPPQMRYLLTSPSYPTCAQNFWPREAIPVHPVLRYPAEDAAYMQCVEG